MTASKLPDKVRPTNTDIMAAMREVHECIHQGVRQTEALARTVAEDRHRTANAVQAMQAQAAKVQREDGERTARLEGMVEAMSRSMGIKPTADDSPPKPVKRFGSQRPFTVIVQVFSATSAALAIMKVAAPAVQAGAEALWLQLTH